MAKEDQAFDCMLPHVLLQPVVSTGCSMFPLSPFCDPEATADNDRECSRCSQNLSPRRGEHNLVDQIAVIIFGNWKLTGVFCNVMQQADG